jgi:hypothetical protein
MKVATAYRTADRFVFHASCRTKDGVWILCNPVFSVAEQDATKLGDAVLRALDDSVDAIPHPDSWEEVFDSLFRVAGVRSWAAFSKSVKCVEIGASGNRVSFAPTKNLGAKQGFVPISARTKDSAPVSLELGHALLAAFNACE